MKAYKCDRCGEYYDKNYKHSDASMYYCGIDIIVTNNNNNFYEDQRLELCDSCISKFFIFLSREKEEQCSSNVQSAD